MVRTVTGTSLALAMLMIAGSPALADPAPGMGGSVQPQGTAAASSPRQAPARTLVPAEFEVPTSASAAGFKIVPLGPEVVTQDYEAYMASIDHLQKTFSRSNKWPRAGISPADAMQDMQNERARFASRKSFAYSVLTPDGKRERGSVYISPSNVDGYDAVVRLWVTQRDYDAGFDAQLYQWVANWVRSDWPFAKVAYPGRSIDWSTWDAMVAASKAKMAAPAQ